MDSSKPNWSFPTADTVEDELENCENGKTNLDLSERSLRRVPSKCFSFVHLTVVTLDANGLTELPDALFESLNQLCVLSANSNELNELNPKIRLLRSTLEYLHLEHNQLQRLPLELAELERLRNLSLDCNLLKQLPSDIARLGRLETLKLYGNDIECLPDLSPLTALNKLDLGANPLVYIDSRHLPSSLKSFSSSLPQQLADGLFIGDFSTALQTKALVHANIKFILTVMDDEGPLYPELFNYQIVNIPDDEDADLLRHLPQCHSFIEEAIKQKVGVLVHCAAGVSRSASVCISYLMKSQGKSLMESFAHVKKVRPIINPNDGFMEQLRQFEKQLAAAATVQQQQPPKQ
jgi:hypothetical protein